MNIKFSSNEIFIGVHKYGAIFWDEADRQWNLHTSYTVCILPSIAIEFKRIKYDIQL